MKFIPSLCLVLILQSAGLALGKLRANVQRIYVTEGESIELTCKAKPKLIRSYRWVYVRETQTNDNSKRDPRVLSSGNRLMVGEPRFSITTQPQGGHIAITLKFEDIRINESGYFMCWRQGLNPDPRVYVKVLPKGAATAQPISIYVRGPDSIKFGSRVIINCIIHPYLPGNVTWFRNGQVVLASDRIHHQSLEERDLEFVASLKVATARQSANYTCMIPSNPPLEKTYEMVVTVGKVEELTLNPDEESIEYGMALALSCIASGTDSQIVWLKDGSQIDLEDAGKEYTQESSQLAGGKWQSILRVPSFSITDNGHYVCYVPGDSKNALVNIEGRPPRIVGVTGWDFMVNDVVHLTCNTQYARDDKEVQWYFNNEPLNSEWWIEKNRREGQHNTTLHDLSIPSATSQHAGLYTCTTSYGSASATVRQIVPPYIVEGPHEPESFAVEGEQFTLVCSVAGYPTPDAVWEKWIDNKWKIVEEAQAEREAEVHGIEITVSPLDETSKVGGERRELFFGLVQPYHAGKYQCAGYVDKDIISVSTELIVKDPKPSIVKLSAEEVMEGENVAIACSVANWDSPVVFTRGLKVLSPEIDARYSLEFQGYGSPFVNGSSQGEDIVTYALIISDVRLEDHGLYECQAGPDTAQSIVVTVLQRPPEIIEMAVSPAVERSEFFISCTVKNIPNDEQAIFFHEETPMDTFEEGGRHSVHLAERMEDPAPVEGGRAKQATYVLKISRAKLEDSGTYHCVVRPESVNQSITVKIAAIETVEEIVNIESYPAWVGGILLLKCSVENFEGEVTFLHNTSLPIEEDDNRFQIDRELSGNITTYTLKIADISSEDSGYYQCFSTPFTFAGANITIREKESLSVLLEQNPPDTPVELNTFVNLRCTLQGIPKSLNYTLEIIHEGVAYARWSSSEEKQETLNERVTFHFADEIKDALDYVEYLYEQDDEDQGESELEANLVLDGVSFGDSGVWSCRVTFDQTGYSRESLEDIEIYDPLEFLGEGDQHIEAKVGSNVTLQCATSGYPIADIHWTKESEEDIILEEGKESADLFIPNVPVDAEGIYHCNAENNFQNISSTYNLRIIHELDITESPEPIIFVSEGDSIELKCVAFGSESPQIEWWKDTSLGEPLTVGTEVAFLFIANFTEEDAGGYTCRAHIGGIERLASTELIFTRKEDMETPLPTTTPAPTLLSGRLVHLSGPAIIEENNTLTLICLVSPLLDAYRAIIVVNNSLIAIDDQVMAQEPRVSFQIGKGGAGERMLKVQIALISKEDSGFYECRANTEILTRHSLHVQVVGQGELDTTTIIQTSTTAQDLELFYEQEEEKDLEAERQETTEEDSSEEKEIEEDMEKNEMEENPLLGASETPLSTSSPPSTTITIPEPTFTTSKSFATTSFESSTYLSSSEESPTTSSDFGDLPFTVTTIIGDDYYDQDLKATIVEKSDVKKDAVIGDSVKMTCTVNADSVSIPIMWKRMSTDSILFVDYIKLTDNEHFSLEIFDGNKTFNRNLKISNITAEDEDDYLCLVQSIPPVSTTIHLKVHESEIPLVTTDSTLQVTQTTEDTDIALEEQMEPEYGELTEEPSEIGEHQEEYESYSDSESDETSTESMEDSTEEEGEEQDEEEGEKKEIQEEEVEEMEKEETGEDQEETTEEYVLGPIDEFEIKEDEQKEKVEDHSETTINKDEMNEYENGKAEDYVTEDESELANKVNKTSKPDGMPSSTPAFTQVTQEEESTDSTSASLPQSTSPSTERSTLISSLTPEEGTLPPASSTEDSPNESTQKSTMIDIITSESPITERAQSANTTDQDEYEYTPYSYETEDYYYETDYTPAVSQTTEKSKYYPVIVATPEEDVIAHSQSEVHLRCPTSAVTEDITWKGEEKMLFLGSLDLAGIEGIRLSKEGVLKLMPGYPEIKNDISYTCLVYDYSTYYDTHVATYHVYLEGEAGTPTKDVATTMPTTAMTATLEALEFFGLEFESMVVLSNNHLAGRSLTKVLQEGGLNVEFVEDVCNGNSSSVEGWGESHTAVEKCELKAKDLRSLKEGQSVFVIIDFLVKLPPSNLYGSTLIYVHDVSRNIKAHVFGPLVPLPTNGDTTPEVECGSPTYDQDLGLDLEGICRSAVSSSVLTLQEAYLAQAKKLPLF